MFSIRSPKTAVGLVAGVIALAVLCGAGIGALADSDQPTRKTAANNKAKSVTTTTTSASATTTTAVDPATANDATAADTGAPTNSESGANASPGGNGSGSGNPSGNGGAPSDSSQGSGAPVAPENIGQANAGTPSAPTPVQSGNPLQVSPKASPVDSTPPSVAITGVSCDWLSVVVVFTASDPSGIADVAVMVKTTDLIGSPNPIKYPGANKVADGIYSSSFPHGKWKTSQISIGAEDSAGNKKIVEKSPICGP